MILEQGNKGSLVEPEIPSPFQNLNEKLGNQNETLALLISRIDRKLQKLSDTSRPTNDDTRAKEVLSDLPFKDGLLMDYWYKINNNQMLIDNLLDQVLKLESLI